MSVLREVDPLPGQESPTEQSESLGLARGLLIQENRCIGRKELFLVNAVFVWFLQMQHEN